MRNFKFTLIVFTVLISNVLIAQNINELSDAAIQKFYAEVQASGLTLGQIELMAKQRGIPSSQITKLKNRIQNTSSGVNFEEIDPSNNRFRNNEKEDQLFSYLDLLDSVKLGELTIYGLNIFKQSKLSFKPPQNLATPENYILGAGDELFIDVYGASEITYQKIIPPDGAILIKGAGLISLLGSSIKEARRRIFTKLSTIYSGLKSPNQNTFLQVSLGKIKTINVNVVGHVVQPGTYTMSSFVTAFNALYYSGGPTETGSMRNIEVIRKGEIIAVLDVYNYLYNGDNFENPLLQDQDILVIKPYINRIKLVGNIKYKAIYELKKEETISDLLRISGGFMSSAFKKLLTIDRLGDEQRKVMTIEKKDFDTTVLMDGDSIYVSKISDRYLNRIEIEGAIIHEGYFELTNDLTLSKLIHLAGGLREDANTKRGNIIRLTSDLRLKNVTFDINEVVNGNQDFLLAPNDIIRIPSIFESEERQVISLIGEVRIPGEYPFIDSMTVEDLVNFAGGLTEKASSTAIEVARIIPNNLDISKPIEIHTFPISATLGISNEASKFLLTPFDVVTVQASSFKQKQKIIKIEGEVKYPGYYVLNSNEEKISDVIKRAGGLTVYGYTEGASLIRRTNFFRTNYQKEELEILLNKKRKELEKRYLRLDSGGDLATIQLINKELDLYEESLIKNLKNTNSSNELKSEIFREQQLRIFQQKNLGVTQEILDHQIIGIKLDKILKKNSSEKNLIMKDGDLLSIPKLSETVKIQGLVLFPTTVPFSKRTGFKQYINQSGGFSSKAIRRKSYVVYANGSAQRTKKFLWFNVYPPIRPGSNIIVPKRERPLKPISLQTIIGLGTTLTTFLLILNQLK